MDVAVNVKDANARMAQAGLREVSARSMSKRHKRGLACDVKVVLNITFDYKIQNIKHCSDNHVGDHCPAARVSSGGVLSRCHSPPRF